MKLTFHWRDAIEKTGCHTWHSVLERAVTALYRGQEVTVIYRFELDGDPALPANQDGSLENPHRWFKLLEDDGTHQETFAGFSIDEVLQSL
jgi:hypothetical protein